MSEIDQAFIRAYQEAHAMPPTPRAAATKASSRPAPTATNKHWRLDAQHAASSDDAQRTTSAAAHSRVPTPHLHFSARGAAWLERPQPQLVAAVTQEFVAEEHVDDQMSASDPWLVPNAAPSNSFEGPRAMGPGFGTPSSPKSPNTLSTPDTYAAFSGSIKPSAAPTPPPAAPLPVRPSSHGPWSPSVPANNTKNKPSTGERIAFVEKHADEMRQHLGSVASTLAMLEGDQPTEIRLEQKEVTLVAGDAEQLDSAALAALVAKMAAPTPQADRPALRIVGAPVEQMSVESSPDESPAAADIPVAARAEAMPPIAPIAPPAEVIPPAQVTAPTPSPAAVETFQPQWEVDQFQWPDVLDRLRDRAGEEIRAACEAIQSSCACGQKVLAIAGVDEAMGGTTMLLALGRELAQHGLRVAVVDADFDSPSLAERTGLRIQHGWEATLTGSLPLEEVTIASLQDRMTLVPLVARQGVSSTMASLHAAKHLRRLCEHFDAVLIDAGVGSENVAALATATADDALDIAVVLAVDERRSEPAAIDELVGRLRHCGIESIQLGETFVSA